MGEFRMPSLGADMESGTIVEWRVAPGDVVRRGDIVAVVDTEKSDIEIETFESGTVGELLVPVGVEVQVGTPLATIVTSRSSADAAVAAPNAPAAAVPELVATVHSPARPERQRVRRAPRRRGGVGASPRPAVSPLARRRAAELGVDLAAVAAAAGGRPVRAADVERAAAGASERGPEVEPIATAPARRHESSGLGAVGRLMARSKREIPHFYVTEDIDVSRALEWIERRNESLPVEQRLLPAVTLLRAVVLALREVPELNAHYVDDAVRRAERVHLAVAIAQREGGLVAPVLRDAQDRSLDELMKDLRSLVARARAGSLLGTDVESATITVTNLGDQGAAAVWGVIVPPQVAIVGFGRIAERPWAVDGMLTVRRVVTATLSADHRACHGHQGARFLRAIAGSLENPEVLG
jgi:pyruvate dehydrogenase E2 component (dihydrolipoamide acetyltransferase)